MSNEVEFKWKMGDFKEDSAIGRCLCCSVPDVDYQKFREGCWKYLTKEPDMPVHLYLDQDIVACHGVHNYWEIKRATTDRTDTRAEVRRIRRCTLDHIVSENVHCGLNVIVLGTDLFWGKDEVKKKDWETDCDLVKIIETRLSPAGREERLKMRDGTPMVVMVAGCPGSGKSTVGKRISHELKIAFIDKDTVAREISEKAIELQKSYEGDYETNAYGKLIRTAQYKDMGLIAAVNLKLKRSVLITAPFNSQVQDLDSNNNIDIDKLCLDPNVPDYMKWPNDGDADSDGEVDSGRGAKNDWKVGLYFVWVETSREVELSRLFARDAKRDSWKLAHWISHAKKQKAELKGLDSKWCSIFYNEYDDDMDSEVETIVKKIKAFKIPELPVLQDKKDDSAHGTKKEGKDDFARAIKVILGGNERLDCYCADFEPLKAIGVDVDEDVEVDVTVEVGRYVQVCELRSSGEFYHVDNDMPHALVVRGKAIKRKIDMDFLSKVLHVNENGTLIKASGESTVDDKKFNIDQLIFEGCTFERAVSLKRLRFDIAFNNCRFEDSMLIFNRKDTVFASSSCGNSSRNTILIFRCTALDDCTISEASADVSIVDSELRDVRLNHVEFDRISIYGSTMNTLEVNANCKVGEKGENGCCFWFRDTRIQDAVLLPNVSFDKMNLNGSIINQVRFSRKTLESLKRLSMKTFWRHDRNVGEDVRASQDTANELIRRSYVVNTLYTSLSACNYYKQADECLWHARELGYRLSLCGRNKYLKKFWEFIKYTIAYRCFGGGIRPGPLLANYSISTAVLFLSLCLAAEWSPSCSSVGLWDMLYIAVVSILNINQSLLGCTGLLNQINTWPWQAVLVMTIGNAYGLVLLAVLMAAIVRKMVR